ncbi:MAG: DUF423 domain-containing protein [Bacteroidota bacterium]|nr:DUF423 domain-containing protein [Bacteroidota bacterium]
MHKNYIVAATVFAGLAVALGAFGAHGLERITADEKILHGFQTGVQYQLYHALALLAVALLYEQLPSNWMKWTGNCFIAGILLFSGSLYLLTFFKIQGSTAVKFAGPITPLGGLFFIAGWLCFLIAALKKK